MIKILSYMLSFIVMYLTPFLLYWAFGIFCGVFWYYYLNVLYKKEFGISYSEFIVSSAKQKDNSSIFYSNEKLITNISYVLFVLNYSFFWPGMFFLDFTTILKSSFISKPFVK